MITEDEQRQLRLLSDTELYPRAITFMRGIGRKLPPTQINGLLNVSSTSTYDTLGIFIERQRTRTTWPPKDSHIPEFYRRLAQELKQLETSASSILNARTQPASREDRQAFRMLIAREFIQHILAENDYMTITQASQPTNRPGFQGKAHSTITPLQRRS